MDCSDILDKAWDRIDIYKSGYICAKDVHNLILEISRCLPSKITTDLNDRAIESWINEDETKKVARSDFLAIFSRLVGTSLETAIFLSKQNQDTPHSKPHLFENFRRFSQDGPSENIEELKRTIEEWKDKYQFLERELQFIISQERNPEIIDTTKHEFIISELSRKIQHQEEAIKSLREQLNYGTSKVAPMSITYKFTEKIKKLGLITLLMMCVFYLVYYFISSLFSHQDREEPSNYLTYTPHEYWWERNHMASRLGWYFKDRLENSIERNNSEILQNYNSVFGIP